MLRRLWGVIAGNLRYKLLVLVLMPMLVLAPTILALSSYWAWKFAHQQMYLKVSTDLSVAHDVFKRMQNDNLQTLRSVADSYAFRNSLESTDNGSILSKLSAARSEHGFDFINLLSSDAKKVLRKGGWQVAGAKASPLMDEVQQKKRAVVGIEIYSQRDLSKQSSVLANNIVLPLVDTPRSVPSEKTTEDRAMLIRVLQPIRNLDGSISALLEGGVLLNRNFRFVDEIRDLVYGPGNLAPGGRGTVTVFLDDVRISTNVPSGDMQRALGTRVSREVHDTVLKNREVWIDRAFVVNDWYISAYEPIFDVHGDSVGMLYAGYLEAPQQKELTSAIQSLAIVLLLGTVFALVLAALGAKSIFKPIESIANVIRATKSGQTRRIGVLPSQDEIGELARQFDSMLDTLEENQQRIQLSADELELKVVERTHELIGKNKRLEQTITLLRETRQQLAMAEKLAALGELTAGVAHEINNPTAVIIGNMDVVIAELGDDAEGVQTELDLIIEQAYRIRNIVDRLLQYSRPSSYAGYVVSLDVHDLLAETLLLVRHEMERKRVNLVEHYEDLGPIEVNRQELQQVLVNLILNAAHAVEEGGSVSIITEAWSDRGIKLRIRDDGVGIPPGDLRRIFDPFYTSGKVGGTGLGLSVSYGIVRRYGGDISVDSLLGEWTEFVVKLRFTAVFESDEEMLQQMNSTMQLS